MSTRAGYAGAPCPPGRELDRPALPGNAQRRRLDSPETRGPRPGRMLSGAGPPVPPPVPRGVRTVPTNRQRRQAAQRHLQRQLERRAELARKRRRNIGIMVTVIAVVVVVGGALLLTGVLNGNDEPSAAADGSSSAPATSTAARTTNADGTISCTYSPDESGNTNLVDVGTPPDPEATPTQGTVDLRMSTNQ